MQDIRSSKAAEVDKLSQIFLKYGADILAKPVSALCNPSISRGVFRKASKVAKLTPIQKAKENWIIKPQTDFLTPINF